MTISLENAQGAPLRARQPSCGLNRMMGRRAFIASGPFAASVVDLKFPRFSWHSCLGNLKSENKIRLIDWLVGQGIENWPAGFPKKCGIRVSPCKGWHLIKG